MAKSKARFITRVSLVVKEDYSRTDSFQGRYKKSFQNIERNLKRKNIILGLIRKDTFLDKNDLKGVDLNNWNNYIKNGSIVEVVSITKNNEEVSNINLSLIAGFTKTDIDALGKKDIYTLRELAGAIDEEYVIEILGKNIDKIKSDHNL